MMQSKFRSVLFFFILFFLSESSKAQHRNTGELDKMIHAGIKRAYSASVKVMGWDTIRKVQNSSQFSAAVVSPDGYILTAAHAIQPGRTYKVWFPDGRECLAVGLGRIDLSATPTQPDVAMMKIITSGNWPFVEMGWSSAIRKDEPCISISYPETLAQPLPSVRFGHITDTLNEWGFFQSTCAMEPGDSGGALYDYKGRLIGLHSRCDKSEDVNMEIPVDYYREYWTALKTAKTYTTLPEVTDDIKTDPLREKLQSFSELNDLATYFGPVAKPLRESELYVLSDVGGVPQKIIGTIIAPGGLQLRKTPGGSLIISKSSCVGEHVMVNISNGVRVEGKVIARSEPDDLVLLQISQKLKGGVNIDLSNQDSLTFNSLGTILLSPLIDSLPRISVVSTMGMNLAPKFSSGYLGAYVTFSEGKATVTRVQLNSPAGRNSLRIGDEISSINGEQLLKPEDFQRILQSYRPGQEALFRLNRKGKELVKKIILATKPASADPNHPAEKFSGGKSARRDGFIKVFAHDARLRPEECGGPVFNNLGQFYGINIARYSRTTTLAVPLLQVSKFLRSALIN
ncbi:trypsin-like peptidase domain-containing protein [Mucilaginibacter sp. KACC 22773]|uniref:trypsin-like peptidase domain-containing protein n=1 Tax=Mucilaginibacter sp. KACC 22773 TaxID=3025671 RepID=UPI002366C254|nr:trypsin-like peptidase domain-containing protein [Mucilaginibacter sp. KACC 22773]WDF77185.1 trypsin-like peptidase domain-containing protein [Mucilaginibacter sp. KACC 22773]